MSASIIKKVYKVATALAAVLALGTLAAGTHRASAADLYNEDAPPPRSGSAYEDPRYADLYGYGPRPRPRIEEYRPYDNVPVPRERVYRDDERGPGPGGRPYAGDRFEPGRSARAACPTKDEISRALERDGWSGFHNPQVLDRETATIDAQRPNGRPFRLEVDRCTGDILAARPLDQRYGGGDRFGPYADGRRWQRSY
jgi:hypothetical protein